MNVWCVCLSSPQCPLHVSTSRSFCKNWQACGLWYLCASAPGVLSFTSIYCCLSESFAKCDLFIIGVQVSFMTEHWLRTFKKFMEQQQHSFDMCTVSFQVPIALCQVNYPAAQLQALQVTLLQKMICFKKGIKFMSNSSFSFLRPICVQLAQRALGLTEAPNVIHKCKKVYHFEA